MGLKMKKWLTNSQFELREARALRQSPSRCRPALVGENFSRVAKFYKVDGEILEAEQKMYASFRRVRGQGYMTVSEML